MLTAETDELKRKAYFLRYQVYCMENEVVDPPHHDNLLCETDEFDARAVQHLLIHKPSQAEVGVVRVVFVNDENPLNSFELQKSCDHELLQQADRIKNLCEISRFCMTGAFRRRPRDGRYLPVYHEQEGYSQESMFAEVFLRRRIPYAPLGLLRASFETAMSRGIVNCVMAVESTQIATLRRLGIPYRTMGSRITRFGFEEPLILNIKAVFDNMMVLNPECWEVLSDNGRLHHLASTLSRDEWHESMF